MYMCIHTLCHYNILYCMYVYIVYTLYIVYIHDIVHCICTLSLADLPVLSTLVVKDHYSMVSDKQCPTFLLRDTGSGSGREVWSWGHQLNQLFVHKMSEALRVLMSLRLLATGPEVERGSSDIYNKVKSHRYMYIHVHVHDFNVY